MESWALLQVIPIMVLALCFGPMAYLLAKEKGRNIVLWTVLGCIPVVNFVCISFFIGAANLRHERKLDEILSRIGK